MMKGFIDNRSRALLGVDLRPDSTRRTVAMDVWIDTGFTGDLVLPKEMIESMNVTIESARSPFSQVTFNLADSLIIKDDWHTAQPGEQSYAVADHDLIGMIDLKPITIDHRHGKWSEWRAILERSQRTVKCVSIHCRTSA